MFATAESSMNHETISFQRLANQQVAHSRFTHPAELVHWMGAIQAQDYLGALWAVGVRLQHATEAAIEQALSERAIVRTWPMRGTIHFVAAQDVRWMLELLTPRVVQRSQARLRQLELDAATISASASIISNALEGGKQRTRNDLYAILEEHGIAARGSRGLHILGQLAHQQLICFGARAGKQPTFTLLEEWAPQAQSLPHEEALATLAKRYFTSHGPATLQDFVWWSGLTVADAKAAIEAVATHFHRVKLDAQEYFFVESAMVDTTSQAFILPPFDEFLIAYRDRSASLDPRYSNNVVPGSNGIFFPIVVIDGRVAGTWKREFKKDTVEMTFSPFTSWSDADTAAIQTVAERYATFVGKTARLKTEG